MVNAYRSGEKKPPKGLSTLRLMSSRTPASRRILRITTALVLSLLVAFVAIGFVKPSVTVETTSRTERSPYVAFDALTDADLVGEWMEGFVSIESVVERDEPVGNQSELTMVTGGDTLILRQEVTVLEPGDRFALTFESDMTSGDITVQLTALEDGTELFVQSRFTGATWWWRSLFPLFAGNLRATQQADYDRLAALMDSLDTPLVGEWAGVDAMGNEQLFHFKPSGALDWRAASGEEWFELNDLHYEVDHATRPIALDLSGFASPPLAGQVLYGIIDFATDDSLRLDLEAGPPGTPSVRPDAFTESAIWLRRTR